MWNTRVSYSEVSLVHTSLCWSNSIVLHLLNDLRDEFPFFGMHELKHAFELFVNDVGECDACSETAFFCLVFSLILLWCKKLDISGPFEVPRCPGLPNGSYPFFDGAWPARLDEGLDIVVFNVCDIVLVFAWEVLAILGYGIVVGLLEFEFLGDVVHDEDDVFESGLDFL